MAPNIKNFASLLPPDDTIDVRNEVKASAFPTLTSTSTPGEQQNQQQTTQTAPSDAQEEDPDSGFFMEDLDETPITDLAPALEEGGDDVDPMGNESEVVHLYSSRIVDPENMQIDEQRLQRALQEAGQYAYGGTLQGIAVWVFDDNTDRLLMPPGGFWVHPDNIEDSECIRRLTDSSRDDFVPPRPVIPGVDIAGLLWMESTNQKGVKNLMKKSGSHANLTSSHSQVSLTAAESKHKKKMVWRNIQSLIDDPDTAKQGPRLEMMAKAGFGQATGVTFHTGVNQGMVIFLAECPQDEVHQIKFLLLNSLANAAYLRQASQFIGAATAMSYARRACVAHQQELWTKSMRVNPEATRAQKIPEGLGAILMADLEKGNDDKRDADKDDKDHSQDPKAPQDGSYQLARCWHHFTVPHRVQVWATKCKGGGLAPPPTLSHRQSLWTCFGAFCGLLVLSSLNEYYQYLSEDDYYLLIGPFGALMTLQYGLTAAPASQPRNAVMGQAVSGAVSLAFTYIPEDNLPVWLRRAVGPAVAIACMVKLGFTHPPAGAHAVLYASGKYNFGFYALVVLSTVISIIPATLVNNMSTKRQYPTYWAFIPDRLWIAFENLFNKRTQEAIMPAKSGPSKESDPSSSYSV